MSVTDNFNRADGGLGANWTTNGEDTPPQIASNQVQGAGSEYTGAYYTGVSWNAAHGSQILRANSSNFTAPSVRNVNAAGYGTWVAYFNHGGLQMSVAGSVSTLGSPSAFASGDTAKLAVSGSVYTCSINGTPDPGGTFTDATLSGGAPGITTYGTTSLCDDWEGTGESGGAGRTTKNTRAFPLGVALGIGRQLGGA